jgi:hypothetical protein
MDLELSFSAYVVRGVFRVLDYRGHLAQARVAAIYPQARPPLLSLFVSSASISAQAHPFRLYRCHEGNLLLSLG